VTRLAGAGGAGDRCSRRCPAGDETTEGFSHDERRWKAGGELMETAFGTPGVGRAGHGRIRPYGMRSTMRERHQRARTKPLGGGGIQR
jgi:hypothetical protein